VTYLRSTTAQRQLTAIVAIFLLTLALAACDSNSSTAASTTNTPTAAGAISTSTTASTAANTSPTSNGAAYVSGAAGSKGVIKIAVDLPVSGAEASAGIPIRNAIELAIEQANAQGELIPGYKLQMYALDDAVNGVHNPQQGVANAQAFIADDMTVAAVGPFNSNVAKAMMPVLNDANLTMISPSNANESLTKPQYGETATLRPSGKVTYFRVATADDVRAPAAADYAIDKLGFKTVYVLDDQETYGKGVAKNFAARFEQRLGKESIVGRDGVPKGTSDYRTILTAIQAKNPAFVYYGGTSANGVGLFRRQMKDVMGSTPLMGPDGIVEGQFLKDAGPNAEGAYGTVGVVNVGLNPKGQAFIEAYKARYSSDPGAYGPNAYEATNIIIAAIRSNAGKWGGDVAANRELVRATIADTKAYAGITGSVGFDQNGDTTNNSLCFYAVKDGKWAFIEQVAVSPAR